MRYDVPDRKGNPEILWRHGEEGQEGRDEQQCGNLGSSFENEGVWFGYSGTLYMETMSASATGMRRSTQIQGRELGEGHTCKGTAELGSSCAIGAVATDQFKGAGLLSNSGFPLVRGTRGPGKDSARGYACNRQERPDGEAVSVGANVKRQGKKRVATCNRSSAIDTLPQNMS